jgi:tetratricopeptide (TPR) repeat protein
MRLSDVLLRLIGTRDLSCPDEADVLSYSEGKLSTLSRERIERHFADCHDCRQVLAFLAREHQADPAHVSNEAVSQQTNRILGYIQKDERNRKVNNDKPTVGFCISYPKLATVGLVICAIAASVVFIVTRDHSAADAMAALRLGLKDSRYTLARISGQLAYSRYAGTTRGSENETDNLDLDRAENKVKAAAQKPTAVEARMVLIRVYLARGTARDARQALAILNQLATTGVETAETLNDTGVAHIQLANYSEAISWFSKALAKSPAYNEALFNRALAEEMTLHNDDDARRDWQRFIEKAPDDSWKNEAMDRLKRLPGAIK